MHISIIIPAYNIAPFLRDCLFSVLDQTHVAWSATIVDDGSTDATATVVARLHDDRVHLIRQQNAGVSAARNRGIAAALGRDIGGTSTQPDAIMFLDGDDWLAPNALAQLAETLRQAPWASVACGRYARVGADGAGHPSSPAPEGDLLRPLLTRNLFANGGHLLIRRDIVAAAGDFRTGLTYGEDWEYWTRIALLGEFMPVRSPAPIVYVRERPGSAYLSNATNPAAYRPALEAIYDNPDIVDRLGRAVLNDLRYRAEAEMAWAIGRELIRHGHQIAGQRWLVQSIRDAPQLKRFLLMGLARGRFGPFRPYETAG